MQKPKVSWPRVSEECVWATVISGLVDALGRLKGAAEKTLKEMEDVIYKYGMERFGRNSTVKTATGDTVERLVL